MPGARFANVPVAVFIGGDTANTQLPASSADFVPELFGTLRSGLLRPDSLAEVHHPGVTTANFFAMLRFGGPWQTVAGKRGYHPAVRYLRNGDPGYPEEGRNIEDVALKVNSAVSYDGPAGCSSTSSLDMSAEEIGAIQVELNRRHDAPGNESLRAFIEERIYEAASDGPQDDGDARYEAMREARDERREASRDHSDA